MLGHPNFDSPIIPCWNLLLLQGFGVWKHKTRRVFALRQRVRYFMGNPRQRTGEVRSKTLDTSVIRLLKYIAGLPDAPESLLPSSSPPTRHGFIGPPTIRQCLRALKSQSAIPPPIQISSNTMGKRSEWARKHSVDKSQLAEVHENIDDHNTTNPYKLDRATSKPLWGKNVRHGLL